MDTTKHKLQELFEAAEIECRSYSGRAMYGKECLGVDTDLNLGELFAAILELVEGEDDTAELQEAFRGMRTDSMGRGTIVYFPNVPFTGEDECEECGEPCPGLQMCEDCAEAEVRP